MSAKVVVIGLDSADSELIQRWSSEGYLENFRRLLSDSAYADIRSRVNYNNTSPAEECAATEILWTTFLTGCKPLKTGYWSTTEYSPKTYGIKAPLTDCSYDYQEYSPFYALGKDRKIAAMNIPSSTISQETKGVQLMGWTGHYPGVPAKSSPSDLLANVIEKYGESPILFKDDGIWWDKDYIQWERQALKESIRSQAQLYQDYLTKQSWDLFIGAFSDLHSAGHDLYAHSEPEHPLFSFLKKGEYQSVNPLRDAYQEIDQAIGQIISKIPEDSYLLIFSPHGIAPNYSDLLSHLYLPELLYRFSFPGKTAIPGNIHEELGPIKTSPLRNGWTTETWTSMPEANKLKALIKRWTPRRFLTADWKDLQSPFSDWAKGTDQSWMPAMWYQPLWPTMKAFALPGFANGHIRINLQGREQQGIVPLSEYDKLCNEIIEVVSRLTDGRTGSPLVKKVVRTRKMGAEMDPKLADPDLVIYWNEKITDVVDSPDFGRIGPVIYSRTGTHRETGFLLLKGPGIKPNTHLPVADIADLPPSILELMGVSSPEYFDGQSILRHSLSTLAKSMSS